jgi:predicted kinase
MPSEKLDAALARLDILSRRFDGIERRLSEHAVADAAGWDESKHPRAEDGKFGSGGGSAKSEAPKVAGKEFSAAEYAKSQDDPNVTPRDLMKSLTPSQRREISRLHTKIAKRGETFAKHRDPETKEYKAERADMHDAILYEGRMGRDPETGGKKRYEGVLSKEAVARATPKPGEKPKFIMLGGRGGSGKSQFEGEVYDKEHAIVLDADVIKHMIEEFDGWNANEVHEESSDILERALRDARKMGLNVVFDATMKSSGGALDKVAAFKGAGYDVEAHYMHLPRQIAAQRAIDRYFSPSKKDPKARGRYVPGHVILGNQMNEANFDQVRQHASRWSFRDNNVERGEKAKLLARGGYDDE